LLLTGTQREKLVTTNLTGHPHARRDVGAVMVTGAAGFIGSHTVEALLSRGDHVVAVDAFTNHYDPSRKRANRAEVEATADRLARAGSLSRLTFVEGDCGDADTLTRAFAAGESMSGAPTTRVIHLAARAGVRSPADQAPDYVNTNVVATTAILEACRTHGFGSIGPDGAPRGHVVIASSSSVYGGGPPGWDGPLDEEMAADRPLSVYAATKRACELVAHAYSHTTGLRVTMLRFFTVVGPRARPDLTPSVFTAAVRDGRPLTRFGDGTMARDYTFVGDTVTGILASLDRFDLAAAGVVESGKAYEVLNLGNDRPVPLAHYLDTLGGLLDRTPVIVEVPIPPSEPYRTWANLTKARRLLGYAPTTSFEDALARFVDWWTTTYPSS
jgi:UDP-glucuronate 4-epimerase